MFVTVIDAFALLSASQIIYCGQLAVGYEEF